MSQEQVPLDTAAEIHELAADGHGRNWIGFLTGVPSSTVKNIISGTYGDYCDGLSIRQRQGLINKGFRP